MSLRVFLVVVFLTAAHRLCAVEIGDKREVVVNQLGSPVGSIRIADKEVLTFTAGERVTIQNGVVTQIATDPISVDSRSDRPLMSRDFRASPTAAKWISLAAGAVVALILSPIYFSSKDEMFRSIRQEEQGPLLSALRGEYEESRWSSLIVHLWLVLPAVVGFCLYFYLLRS